MPSPLDSVDLGWLGCVAHVAAVGAQEDHLADPEASDERCIAGDGAVIGQSCAVLLVLRGAVFTQSRQLAPVVESEHACRDDCGEIQAAAETPAAAGQTSSVEAPGAEDHQGRVCGKQDHCRAAECVDDAEAVSIIVTLSLGTARIFNVFNQIGRVRSVRAVVDR